MVGHALAHPVAVALPGLPLALVGACGRGRKGKKNQDLLLLAPRPQVPLEVLAWRLGGGY